MKLQKLKCECTVKGNSSIDLKIMFLHSCTKNVSMGLVEYNLTVCANKCIQISAINTPAFHSYKL